MVITPPIHTRVGTTAGPSECLWPVLVQLRLVTLELFLKLLSHIVGLFDQNITPTLFVAVFHRIPGNEF